VAGQVLDERVEPGVAGDDREAATGKLHGQLPDVERDVEIERIGPIAMDAHHLGVGAKGLQCLKEFDRHLGLAMADE